MISNSRLRFHAAIRLLSVLGAAITIVPHMAMAEREFSSTVRYYDDGWTQVISPAIEIGSTFNEDRMKLGLHVAQDILTSASSEVKTFSSKGVITDLRNEYQINFESQVPDGTLSVGVVTSDEKDYSSRAISAGEHANSSLNTRFSRSDLRRARIKLRLLQTLRSSRTCRIKRIPFHCLKSCQKMR